ncbi:glycosyltransferase family 2 protein [Clostridium botulinum]|uniref:glycosyltransferase family 2 protein n=1 Tax=Clostridium botulinum TaxID=1491 RepID=UPI0007748E49|nr:glycosyltransferase family 2 protein [Clostridium botulinum]MBY6931424.1 glycosyltransferase family 2 protein [Clostridium botulinum]NFG22227.1 glycosyltransferase family 2 protein [Clostridium botulinum]NFO80529.1 glycosyltransferase family 2 protein [Clostridium botulinum]HBJ1647383.1 glycosyltransferase family 2 protein [Clostridium botulinum]
MKDVLISIIMPVFNAEKYLEKSIKSVLNQTFENFEFIIINDNSTDKSEISIKHFSEKDPRIKYIENVNKGVSNARNLGIDISIGKYITFIDADDYICNNTLEKMYSYINESSNDICMAGYVEESENKKIKIELPYKDKEILDKLQIKLNIIPKMIAITKNDNDKNLIMGSVCRLLIRRKIIEENNIKFNSKVYLAEDLLFCIEVFLKANTIIIMKECYYSYIRYGNTTLEKYRENFLEESLFFYNEYEQLLRKLKIFNENKERFYTSKCSMYTTAISNYFRYDSPKNHKKRKQGIKRIIKVCNSDCSLKKNYTNNISFMKKVAFKLIKCNRISFLILFFSIKEKIRRHKI